MRWLAALLVAVAACAGGAQARQAAYPATLTCKGTACKLTVKNASGNALMSLAALAPKGISFVKASDPKATPTTTSDDQGNLVTHPAGECVTFEGSPASFSCSYIAGGKGTWAPDETRTVSFTTNKTWPAGEHIELCGQANGANSFCGDVAPAGSATSSGGNGKGRDLYVAVEGTEHVRVLHSKPAFTVTYEVEVGNQGGEEASGAVLNLNAGPGKITFPAHCPQAHYTSSDKHGVRCILPTFEPGRHITLKVVVTEETADFTKRHRGDILLGAFFTRMPPEDPPANNRQTIHTRVEIL